MRPVQKVVREEASYVVALAVGVGGLRLRDRAAPFHRLNNPRASGGKRAHGHVFSLLLLPQVMPAS